MNCDCYARIEIHLNLKFCHLHKLMLPVSMTPHGPKLLMQTKSERKILNFKVFFILGCDIGTMEVLIESSTVEVKAAARCQSYFFFVTDAKKC